MDKGGIGDKNSVLSEIYNIPDTNPVARYTSGPVAIGIETNTQPVGIAGDGSTKPLFGVTIENLWEGKITKVNSLKMETIPGLQINTGSCDHSTNGGNNIYTISNIKGEIEFYKSFRCKMQASKSALDSTPVTIRNLKATAKYQYVIEDELYFDVEEYDFGEI